jgi:hypothetical protein
MTFTRTDDAVVRQILTVLRDTDWTWHAENIDVLVTRLGWHVNQRANGGFDVELPRELPTRRARLGRWSGGLSQVDFDLAVGSDETPETEDAANDAFADFAAIATEILGPPTETEPGPIPSVTWRSAGSTFRLDVLLGEVTLNWSSNAYQQFLEDTEITQPELLEDDE